MNGSQLFHCTFNEFEAFTETAKLWSLEYHKLDTVPFSGEIFQLFFPDCVICRGRLTGKFKQLGTPPPGMRTFTLFASERHHMTWRGHSVDGSNFTAFPLGGELNAITGDDFDIFTVSVPDSKLASLAERADFQGLEKRLNAEEVLQADTMQLIRLRQCLHRIIQPFIINREELKEQILLLLIEAINQEFQSQETQRKSARRQHAAQQVDRLILSRPEDPYSIRELSRLTQVSERTLEYAFSELYGIKPKAYVNRIRLNQVRKLIRQGGCKGITDAANAWGFWHMGQFARDYRKLFGELPSDTLNGCSG